MTTENISLKALTLENDGGYHPNTTDSKSSYGIHDYLGLCPTILLFTVTNLNH
jgi:hypothetical protein